MKKPQYVIRMKNGYGLRFIANLCTNTFELAINVEPTLFPTPGDASFMFTKHRLNTDLYEVTEFKPKTQQETHHE